MRVNGTCTKSAEIKNGRPVYAKEGDSTVCCFYATNKTWMVTGSDSLDANDCNKCSACTTTAGLLAPQLAPEGGWKVCDGDAWSVQKQVIAKTLPALPFGDPSTPTFNSAGSQLPQADAPSAPLKDGFVLQAMGVAVAFPNENPKSATKGRHKVPFDGKPSKATAGIYIGDRRVKMLTRPHGPPQYTYFGHRMTSTSEIEEMIGADDQILWSKLLADASPVLRLLQKFWDNPDVLAQLAPQLPKQLVPDKDVKEFKLLPGVLDALRARATPGAAPPKPVLRTTARSAADWPWASPKVENWFKQNRSLDRHHDPEATKLLQRLSGLVQATFPGDFATLVPYGSMIYEVGPCDGSTFSDVPRNDSRIAAFTSVKLTILIGSVLLSLCRCAATTPMSMQPSQ